MIEPKSPGYKLQKHKKDDTSLDNHFSNIEEDGDSHKEEFNKNPFFHHNFQVTKNTHERTLSDLNQE